MHSARTPTEEIKKNKKNLLCVTHACPKAYRTPEPVPVSCVIKGVIFFGHGAHTNTTDFKSQLTKRNELTVEFDFTAVHILSFPFAVSTAHPAAVQQLQGLHEAQAHLSNYVGQGVPLRGECKMTVND